MPNFSLNFNQTLDQGSWVPFDVSVIFGMVFLIITICNSRGGISTVVCTMYNIFKYVYSRKQKTDTIQKRMNCTKNWNKKWRVNHTTSSFQTFPSIWITKKRNISCHSRTFSNACKHYICTIFFFQPTWNLCCMEHWHYSIHKVYMNVIRFKSKNIPKDLLFCLVHLFCLYTFGVEHN